MALAQRQLGLGSLVAIGFFWVSGGIYGNETLIHAAPPAVVISVTLAMAILYALPMVLMTAELATAFPEDGGQVVWVKEAWGSRIGAHNAFWVWLQLILDAAVYPGMAVGYLGFTFSEEERLALCLGVVVFFTCVNWLGVTWVARAQIVAFAAALLPCLIFLSFGLPRLRPNTWISMDGQIQWMLLISYTAWIYSGFQSLGVLAGEVIAPTTTYFGALGILFPLVICFNVGPVLVSLSLDSDISHYVDGYFAVLSGRLLFWLPSVFKLGAVVSLLGLYHAQVTAADLTLQAFISGARASRGCSDAALIHSAEVLDSVPQKLISKLSNFMRSAPQTDGPSRLVTLCNALCVGMVTLFGFQNLIEIEMVFFSLSRISFCFSFVALRWQQPEILRPLRVPGGPIAAFICVATPLAISFFALACNLTTIMHIALLGAILTLQLLVDTCWRFGGGRRHVPSSLS
eukprot:TRINITY_DN41682_c0_g1_i1.p1 TRINITY_DN41682_c0_g1~~TRINITY_DN41682_c0_g1_i1.p1  ORF type:complete len:459 (+),score=56.04 TRINITY_DN41682_c0_g1_i1:102-1478(+)